MLSRTLDFRGPSAALLFLAAGLTLPTLAPPASAQDGTATVRGRVVTAATGEAVTGAEVSFPATDRSALTSAEGLFLLEELPPGPGMLEVRFLGTASRSIELMLTPGDTELLRIALDVRVIPLPGLDVTVEREVFSAKLAGFYDRMQNGPGQFLTREEIEERDPHRTTDLFRTIPGVRVVHRHLGRRMLQFTRRNGCEVAFFVDGIRTPYLDVDGLPPTDLDGIEVYRGVSEVPIRFRRPATCAAVVLWTRDPGVP